MFDDICIVPVYMSASTLNLSVTGCIPLNTLIDTFVATLFDQNHLANNVELKF